MIACWLHKRAIARSLDENQPLSERAQRHVQGCPICRQFYELESELVRRLIAGADSHRRMPSLFLHAKIMASLERRSENAAPVPKTFAPIWATALMIGAVALLSLLALRSLQQPKEPVPHQASASLKPVPRQLASDRSVFTASNVVALSKALDQPLETEMQSVVKDAKTALHLLAQNFLPEQALDGR